MPERMPSITSVVAAGTEIITTLSINGSINFTRGSTKTVTHLHLGINVTSRGRGRKQEVETEYSEGITIVIFMTIVCGTPGAGFN